MLRNNKGFTVIELIMSFLFASILAISLFSVIVTYRNKQVDSTIETDLLAFKSQFVMDVQEDFQLRGVREINYCTTGNADNPIIPRCVVINFNDGTSKELKVLIEVKEDTVENDDGIIDHFNYELPYIVYGDIKYNIPDAANVYIDDDYILQSTGPLDGIESGTNLYKIGFNLKHNDLDVDIDVSIVTSGSIRTNTSTGPYKSYVIGDIVFIQLNDSLQRQFRVIQNSSTYKDSLILLYDDVYDSSLVLDSTIYNELNNISNRYSNSSIKNKVYSVSLNWNNADEVRLITVDEVSRIAALCPKYKGADSGDISLGSAPDWLINKVYWTMSEKELSGENSGKKAWYVNGPSRTLSYDFVNVSHTLRPVIVIKKTFVTNIT